MTTNENLMADLTGIDVPTMHDIIDDRVLADRDDTPVPAEFQGMSFEEIVEYINEAEAEEAAYWKAQNEIPYRWE